MSISNVVQKIWGMCNILRGDGIGYNEYMSELTYLLFLKIAKETGTEVDLPEGRRWDDLISLPQSGILSNYKIMDLSWFSSELTTHLCCLAFEGNGRHSA